MSKNKNCGPDITKYYVVETFSGGTTGTTVITINVTKNKSKVIYQLKSG